MTTSLVRAADERRCALYRHYDENDVLLYVGITETLGDRTNRGHARSSDWVEFADRAEAEWHDSRDLASAAERDAVREERPVYNRQYAEWDVDQQILSYLQQREIEHLKSAVDEYEHVVRRFLGLAPEAEVKSAEAKALADYRHAGGQLDQRFPASVLRHLANAWQDQTTEVRDDATAAAYMEMVEFLGARLEVIRDRRKQLAEPPF